MSTRVTIVVYAIISFVVAMCIALIYGLIFKHSDTMHILSAIMWIVLFAAIVVSMCIFAPRLFNMYHHVRIKKEEHLKLQNERMKIQAEMNLLNHDMKVKDAEAEAIRRKSIAESNYLQAQAWALIQQTSVQTSILKSGISEHVHILEEGKWTPLIQGQVAGKLPVREQIALPSLPSPYDFVAELQDWKPAPNSIFLARGASGRITVPLDRLWHLALTGPTGGGKSTILRLILTQLLFLNMECILCDINYAPIKRGIDWRPIASRLSRPVVRDIDDMYEVTDQLARGELEARRDREFNGEPVGEPIYLAIEELPAVVGEKPEIMKPIAKLLRESRQYGIYFFGATQDMLVKTLGTSSGVRECFRTGYYTGGDQRSASIILDLQSGQKIDEEGLGVDGLVYLKTVVHPASKVRIPLASNNATYYLLGEVENDVHDSTYRHSDRVVSGSLDHGVNIDSRMSMYNGQTVTKNTSQKPILHGDLLTAYNTYNSLDKPTVANVAENTGWSNGKAGNLLKQLRDMRMI